MTLSHSLRPLIAAFSLPLALYAAGCGAATQRADTHNAPSNKDMAALQADIKAMQADITEIKGTLNTFYKLVSTKMQEEQPKPAVTELRLDSGHILGKHDAKVAIVEFSDYQCPFCRAFHAKTMPALKSQYIDTGKVQFIYRDFPFDFHPQSVSAAVAARCAGDQNAYWEMHDALFEKQDKLGAPLYKELAQQLHIDANKFDACINDASSKTQLSGDMTYGQQVGVDGTPTFFVGRIEGDKLVGVKSIVGAQPPEVFAQLIDTYLK